MKTRCETVQRGTGGVQALLHFRLQLILLRLKEALNDGVNQFIQFLLQLGQVAVEEVGTFEWRGKKKKRRKGFLVRCSDLALDAPVTWSGAQLRVVFNLGLRAAGAHGGHAPVGEGESDHLAGGGCGKNLGARNTHTHTKKQKPDVDKVTKLFQSL